MQGSSSRLMSIITIALALSAMSFLHFGCGKQAETVKGEIAARVDQYLSRIEPFGFSGAALVARGDQVLLNKGYGLAIITDNIPNTSQTIFSTGSITKQFTAAAIMKLQMMGKLSTADSITKYFDNVPEDKQMITLRHLLTHTSGFPGALGPDFEEVGRDEMMERILKAPLEFPAGEDFGYSNCGYSMLAAIVELVSETPYEQFLNDHLFKPAGMKRTGYRLPDWDKETVAHWYDGDIDNGIPLDKDYPYWNYIGNGGILSTTEDMLLWHRALMGDKVLSAEAKEEMYTPYLNDYAYGWDYLETERGALVQHDGGSMLGCAAEFKRFLDSNVVIVMFSNRSGVEILHEKGVRDRVTDLVFGAELELPLSAANTPVDPSLYSGNYLLDENTAYLVSPSGDCLEITPFGREAITGLYLTGDSLLNEIADNEKRSLEVLSAAVKEDFEPFRVLVNDDERLERIKRLWYMRLNRHAEMTGPLTGVKVRFSWPSGYEAGANETLMEIEGEQGSFFYFMIWKGGKMIGLAPVMPPNIGPLRLVPLGDDEFFTYDISAARNIRVAFEADTLKIMGEDGSLKAVRGQ